MKLCMFWFVDLVSDELIMMLNLVLFFVRLCMM